MKVKKRDVRRRLQFFAAILVAALFADVRKAETWRRALTAFSVFFDFRRTGLRTPRWVYYQRMRACHQCSLYEPILGTCGSAWRKDLRTVGCRCYMPAKAAILDEECWLHEQLDDRTIGWPQSAARFSGFDPGEPASGAVVVRRGCGDCRQPGEPRERLG